jgi:type II secretory pathway pseudopilin PulG
MFKKIDKKATSLVEVLVIMLIVSIWILWAFKLFSSWQKLSLNTKNKIQAINIAREGIEAVTNIRNTNWFLFSSDYESCWNSFDYNSDCIWDKHTDNTWNKYINSGSYIVYSTWSRWFLEKKTVSWTYKNSDYRNIFRVNKTGSWFYTQSWWTEFKPIFTREIQISYSWTVVWSESFSGSQMQINSKVYWVDSSSSNPHKVVLKTVLTPWKD